MKTFTVEGMRREPREVGRRPRPINDERSGQALPIKGLYFFGKESLPVETETT